MNPLFNSNEVFAQDAAKYVFQPEACLPPPPQVPVKPFKITTPDKSEKNKKDMKKSKEKSKKGKALTPFELMSGDTSDQEDLDG